MNRRRCLAPALLALVIGVAACRPVDGGAGGSPSPEPSMAVESNVAPLAPTDPPAETPIATVGGEYPY
ncbi:MAG TPA: hypothetical protein VFY43_00860 [Candidatus Limnocylindria bacterium]|nr:hypothetical protein [Candidatus Limnocylindria bacterium]